MPLTNDRCVVIFSNTFWSIYNFRRTLIKQLQKQGYKVIALAANDSYRSHLEELGCETKTIQNLDAKSTSLLKELRLIKEVRSVLRDISCEYIYTFTIKPNLYTPLANVLGSTKIILTVSGLGNAFLGGNFLQRISLQLFRMAFRQAHRIVFQNRDDYSYFQSKMTIGPNKVLLVRGSGVNTEEFNVTSKSPLEGNQLTFLLACRLLKEKGVYEYIETARRIKARFPDTQFWLIGMPAINHSSIDIEDLQPFDDEGVIRLIPPTDYISKLLDKVDVLILPSFYNEGVPRILLEGLGKGLPLITTNSVGCKETVIDGCNGYLIEPRSIESLETAVSKMIALPVEERMKMGRESRRLAETEFDEAKVIGTYVDIIKPAKFPIAIANV